MEKLTLKEVQERILKKYKTYKTKSRIFVLGVDLDAIIREPDKKDILFDWEKINKYFESQLPNHDWKSVNDIAKQFKLNRNSVYYLVQKYYVPVKKGLYYNKFLINVHEFKKVLEKWKEQKNKRGYSKNFYNFVDEGDNDVKTK